jgi:primosomal protein N''
MLDVSAILRHVNTQAIQYKSRGPHSPVTIFYNVKAQNKQFECVITVKVKGPRYRPGVAQRVGTGIALLFYDRGTRRGE